MGKTKQVKVKKFDRSVEISAPILDADTIRAIHSPPEDKKLDIRHGGFKALLSDLNSQDSTDEVAPIIEGYRPSYIGISCAVSGYSNYSSYSRRAREAADPTNGANTKENNSPTSSRSQTAASLAKRLAEQHQQSIHHVTIDKSAIGSPDQERRVLTEKLTASASERHRRSPSPLPPVEDGRHHGAYVGARYFPMPEPSKVVHKHIPLLGIDDDEDPDQTLVEPTNKVEDRIANLYGEEFVEDWRESMSHKSKKELHEEAQQQQQQQLEKKPKDLVHLKHVPAQAPRPAPQPADVPTPDVQVLHGVEKQFLNRLLSDENPPVPKSASPQPTSPVSPRYSRPVVSPDAAVASIHASTQHAHSRGQSVDSPPPRLVSPPARKPTPPPVSLLEQRPLSPKRSVECSPQQPSAMSPVASPESVGMETREEVIMEVERRGSPVASSASNSRKASPAPHGSPRDSPIAPRESESQMSPPEPIAEEVDDLRGEIKDEIMTPDEQLNAPFEGHVSAELSDDPRAWPTSPDGARESPTKEESGAHEPSGDLIAHQEDHIEYQIRTQSPVNNESSPVRLVERLEEREEEEEEATNVVERSKEAVDFVSFYPESSQKVDHPSEHNNNNINDNPTVDQLIDLNNTDILEATRNGAETQPSTTMPPGTVVRASEALVETHTPNETLKDGRYFLSTLENEESFIMDQVKSAESRLAEHEADWDEETIGKVRSAIGKANLLINKKCKQFRELCEKSLVNDASDQYAVLNDDLAGFWDMISIQIADVKRSFESL